MVAKQELTPSLSSVLTEPRKLATQGIGRRSSSLVVQAPHEAPEGESEIPKLDIRQDLTDAEQRIDDAVQQIEDSTGIFEGRLDALDDAVETAQGEIEQAKTDLGLIETDLSPGGGTYDRITDALVQAGDAQDAADNAQSAAAGKSAIYYSTEAPSGTGTRQGDVWFQRDSQGSTIGMWEWTGASWQSRTLRNEVIANLDAGKITTGYLAADRLNARSITAEKLVLGSSENLIPNGNGEFGDFGGWASFTNMNGLTWETTDAPAGVAGYLRSTWAGAKTTAADAIEVDPDGEYLFEVWIRADKPDSRLYLDARAGTSNTRAGVTKAIPGYESGSFNGVADPPAGYLIHNKPVPTSWTRVVGAFRPNGVSSIRVGGLITNHTTSAVQDAVVDIGGLRMIRRASAELIVDGAVTADKVAARSITANKLVLGSTSNLIPNGLREFGTLENMDSRFTIATGPAEIPGAFLLAEGTQAWHDFAHQSPAPVQPGQKYHLETWLYSNLAGQSIAVRTDWLDSSGTYLTGTYDVWPTNLAVGWTKFEREITPPANAVAVRWMLAPNHQNGTVQNARPGVAMRLREKASLIVDGAITAEKVQAESVAAAVGVFIDAMMENLTVTGVANMSVTVANELYAKMAVVDKLQALSGIITTDMIATGAVTASKITVTEELVAQIASFLLLNVEQINLGRDARWDEDGLVFYAPPAQGQDPNDWPNRTELIALTPTGDMALTVAQDGEPTAGLTSDGEVWGRVISGDDMILSGTSVSELIQQGPRGVLGVATSSNFMNANTTLSPYISLSFVPDPTRMYELEFNVRGGIHTASTVLSNILRQARPGASATSSTFSRNLGSWDLQLRSTSGNFNESNRLYLSGQMLANSTYLNADGESIIWACLQTSTGTAGINAGTLGTQGALPPTLVIKDVGPQVPVEPQTVSSSTPPPPPKTQYGPVTISSGGAWGVRPDGSNAIDPRLTLGGYNIYGTDMAEWILYPFNFSRLNGSTVNAANVQVTVTQNAPVTFTCFAGTGPTQGHVALFTATANGNGTIKTELSSSARQALVGKTCLVLKPFYPGNTASYGYFASQAHIPVIYTK